jgi:hypothetical protein
VSAGFDWSPYLIDHEQVLWSGRPSKSKFFTMSAVVCAIVLLALWMALVSIGSAPGGTLCTTEFCPKADRKAGLVLITGPLFLILWTVLTLLFATSRLDCAVTNKRALTLHRAYWRKRPKFMQVAIHGAYARISGFNLTVFDRHSGQRVELMARSSKELRTALAFVEDLSGRSNSVTSSAS